MNALGGYNQIYEHLRERLKAVNLEEAATRLGLSFNKQDGVIIGFLGGKYIIDNNGVRPLDGKPRNINIYNVLAFYILSEGAGEPAHEFEPLRASAYGYSNLSWMIKPLAKLYDGKYDKFENAALSLGGEYQGRSGDGGYAWVFPILPKIPLKAVYYERDEEFQFELKIFVDRHARRFLEFECLAFMCGCFVSALEKAVD